MRFFPSPLFSIPSFQTDLIPNRPKALSLAKKNVVCCSPISKKVSTANFLLPISFSYAFFILAMLNPNMYTNTQTYEQNAPVQINGRTASDGTLCMLPNPS